MREHWYDPSRVLEAGAAPIREQWEHSDEAADSAGEWVEALVTLAAEVVALYGPEHQYLDGCRSCKPRSVESKLG